MSEHCRIGLHEFTPWEETGSQQSRRCVQCRHKETRPWQREHRPPYNPYAEL